MYQAEKIKSQIMTPVQLKDNGDLADNAYLDTNGYREASVLIITGDVDAALGSTAETTAPYLEECDTTDGTYTSFACQLSAAIASTKSDKLYRMNVKLDGSRKRYIRVNAPHSGDGTTGVYAAIVGELIGPLVDPNTDTLRGLDESVSV